VPLADIAATATIRGTAFVRRPESKFPLRALSPKHLKPIASCLFRLVLLVVHPERIRASSPCHAVLGQVCLLHLSGVVPQASSWP